MKESKNILETNRLLLRELGNSDLDELMIIFTNELTMKSMPGIQTREQGAEWLAEQRARYQTDGCGYWACELRKTGDFVGYAGLIKDLVNGQPELRFDYQFMPSHRFSGFAGEIMRGCLAYGFEKYKVPQIVALIRPDNEAFAGVAQRVGMTLGKHTTHLEAQHGIWGMKRGG